MKQRAVVLAIVMVGLLGTTGCRPTEGDSMLEAGDWTTARQQQIDLVTEVAREASTDAYVVAESIGVCEDGDDLDRSIGASDYFVNALSTPNTQAQLDQVVRPRLKAEGWSFRDNTSRASEPDGTALAYDWAKEGSGLSVTIVNDGHTPPIVTVYAVSPCGKLGDVRYGDVQSDDPWFLAPTVEGPTIDDNRPLD